MIMRPEVSRAHARARRTMGWATRVQGTRYRLLKAGMEVRARRQGGEGTRETYQTASLKTSKIHSRVAPKIPGPQASRWCKKFFMCRVRDLAHAKRQRGRGIQRARLSADVKYRGGESTVSECVIEILTRRMSQRDASHDMAVRQPDHAQTR